jgi:nucleoside-diphosphate-sugar epimerase
MRKRVALTGGSGFIGSHLAPFLLHEGYEIHYLARTSSDLVHFCGERHEVSLSDGIGLTRLLGRIRPHFILHLAGRAKPSRDLDDFHDQIRDTVLPTVTLARSIPADTELGLFFGSCEEYGDSEPPFREDQSLKCFSPYGWAKLSAWHATMMIARQKRLSICWARPFLTFGPRQNTNQVIPTLIRGCLVDAEIPLSPGHQTRDFLFVADLCQMVLQILRHPSAAHGETLNLCTGKDRTVRSIAESIRRLAGGGRFLFGALPYREEEAMRFYGSREKYERLFGRIIYTDFEAALKTTIDAYRNEYQ